MDESSESHAFCAHGVMAVSDGIIQPNPFNINEHKLYSVREVAKLLNIHRTGITRKLSAGILQGVKTYGVWRVRGLDLIRSFNEVEKETTFLELPYDSLKLPQSSFLMYLMITAGNDPDLIIKECQRYSLLEPLKTEIGQIWEALKKTAPRRIRKRMERNLNLVFDSKDPENENWLRRLGILEMFGKPLWPCQNILEDQSDRRIYIEVMIVGRVLFKEIIRIMATKFNFITDEPSLTFFAAHFLNVYNYNDFDRIKYITRLRNQTEKYNKQRAWGDPNAAKAVLEIPNRVNFEETLNMVAAMSALNFSQYALAGPEMMPVAKDASQMIFHALRSLLALEKQRTEQVAVATQQAQSTGPKQAFENAADEAPSYGDLDQPNMEESKEKPQGPQLKVG